MPPRTNTTSAVPPAHTTPIVERLRQLVRGAVESEPDAGAIVGGVFGGVLGLVLLAVLGWYLWRRRKQRATWDYAMPAEFDVVDEDIKPYIVTPYITCETISYSRPGSPTIRPMFPPSRMVLPESVLDIASSPYNPVSPERVVHVNDPDAWSEIAVDEMGERARSPSIIGRRVISPASSFIAGNTVTPPTPCIAAGGRITSHTSTIAGFESTAARAGRPSSRTDSLMSATAGLVSATVAVAGGLKEAAKRKRKSKIQSVPRPPSFCIDKSKTEQSPLDDVPPQFSPMPMSAMSATFTQ